MKILGVSLGTKNGNNDTMCRVALEAAKEKGVENEEELEILKQMDIDNIQGYYFSKPISKEDALLLIK